MTTEVTVDQVLVDYKALYTAQGPEAANRLLEDTYGDDVPTELKNDIIAFISSLVENAPSECATEAPVEPVA